MKLTHRWISGLLMGASLLTLSAQNQEKMQLNQIGFYPSAPKIAVVVGKSATPFTIVTDDAAQKSCFKGKLSKGATWEASGESASKADFSAFKQPGRYRLVVKGLGTSYPFEIKENVSSEAATASLKMFYFQRCSSPLLEKHVGNYAREAGHPDTEVVIHNSAASSLRPGGFAISSPRGWYDAGDYNKYIVNSGITMYTLFSLMEDYPAYCKQLNLNIPESSNNLPDLVDEINWNLRWMLTMQDPSDGGVYHKLTNANFDGSISPKAATKLRYVVQKSTAASLDFAAVMAYAARFYKNYEKELPGLADSCLTASKKAYAWAKANPNLLYLQEKLYGPAITTGAYDDNQVKDEFFWAASELFVTTLEQNYWEDAKIAEQGKAMIGVPEWAVVGGMGVMSLAKAANQANIPADKAKVLQQLRTDFIAFATDMANKGLASPYGVPMGVKVSDFVWGSNAVAANQSFVLLSAYNMSRNAGLRNAALANLDYLLGRNATGYCFLTGFGSRSTRYPHHRLSESDGIEAPIPGLLAGGPNPGIQDKEQCAKSPYRSTKPALAYIDEQCSFASNEVAINWNAPFAYAICGIEATSR